MSENGSIRVIIPTPLRRFTDGQAQVNATGATVAEVLSDLDARFPGLKERICGENVRKAQGAATPLKPGDEIGIIPAMAGGSHQSR
jgi:molybdopterin synthase sulfur carrier subunit